VRWPADRFREIEQAAEDLLIFHDEFVANVKDIHGLELGESGSAEWSDMVECLRRALKPCEEGEDDSRPHDVEKAALAMGTRPCTNSVYVDGGRTDNYKADGTKERPYKTLQDARSGHVWEKMHDDSGREMCQRCGAYREP
jgi:hypothetical protein